MKAEIHPNYKEVQVVCACGSKFVTRSTLGKEQLNIDICNACHPFYTGKHKVMDTEGRIDKFMRRYNIKSTEQTNDGKED